MFMNRVIDLYAQLKSKYLFKGSINSSATSNTIILYYKWHSDTKDI